MEVGVRALKQQLSKYLDDVKAGTELIVTDRGRPVARIVPVSEEGVLSRGVEEGWIRPARSRRTLGGATRHRSVRRTSDVLDDDRA